MRNLNEIECFVKALELKSLTAAGKALKLPKSSIRSKVKNLEERELHDLPAPVVSSFMRKNLVRSLEDGRLRNNFFLFLGQHFRDGSIFEWIEFSGGNRFGI